MLNKTRLRSESPRQSKKTLLSLWAWNKTFLKNPQATLFSKIFKHLNELQKLNPKVYEIFPTKKLLFVSKFLMEGLFIELYSIRENVFNGDCWAQLSIWEMSWHFQTPPTFSPHYKFEWKKWKLSSLLFFQIYFWQSSIWKGECKKCNLPTKHWWVFFWRIIMKNDLQNSMERVKLFN